MKPNTTQAMQDLIERIRSSIPFDLKADDICADECRGCSVKLIEYLESEVSDWEYRLANHEIPNFRDLSRLAKSSKKIYHTLVKNGLITDGHDQAEA